MALPAVLTFIFSGLLLCCSALFSGLNLGLLSLDLASLEIIIEAGDPRLAKYAKKIYPIRKHGNWLLCTLLLGNVCVNSALSILLADFTSGTVGFIVSSALIVIFGEISPQAGIFKHGLYVGAKTVGIVKFFMFILAPIAWPLSKVLDYVLGGEVTSTYSKNELKKLVSMHQEMGKLSKEEQQIISGALDFNQTPIASYITKIEDVFMMEIDTVLTIEVMKNILEAGFSRIPVYEKERSNIVGVLFAKDLILLNPADAIPLRTMLGFCSREIPIVFPDTKPVDLLNLFKNGRSHIALVQDVLYPDNADPTYRVLGIVTMEDVLETLIHANIEDETDMHEMKLNYDALASPTTHKTNGLSDNEVAAVVSYLRNNVKAFACDIICEDELTKLITNCTVSRINSTDPGSVYERGQPCTSFTLVLHGGLTVLSGAEQFKSEIGPYTPLGFAALTEEHAVCDMSAYVVPGESVELLRVSRESYLAAVKASKATHTQPAPVTLSEVCVSEADQLLNASNDTVLQ